MRAHNEAGWFGMKKATRLVFKMPGDGEAKHDHSIPIRGLQGELPVRFAPNGGAVPGDRIVGILTPGEGSPSIQSSRRDLTAFDDQPERWLDVRWDVDEGRPRYFRQKPSSRRSTSPARSA